jgi:hydrophobic/amphiphilic exporter-1 (mainly G- bacteria), HAE1 family
MSTASFSIKRPIVIISIVAIMLVMGVLSINNLGVDMYPDVEMPFISVMTTYPGAGPEEVEEQISKPIESEISSIAGLKKIHSSNFEGYSVVWGEFTLDSDVKYCEQQVRDKVAKIRKDFPEGTEEPKIERFEMSRNAVVILALQADLDEGKLYDLAKDTIKPAFEQIAGVGTVQIKGGAQREIQIELDRNKLNQYKIPASYIADRLKTSGINVPMGKYDVGQKEMLFRSVGRFKSVSEIQQSVILFSGDANNSVTLNSLGKVYDGVEDKTIMTYVYGRDAQKKIGKTLPCVFISVYKQSGSNTVKVVETVLKKLPLVNKELSQKKGAPKLVPIHDNAKYIKINVDDVKFSIIAGIILAILIVYLFLGNIRSTLITGIAIPNSLLGGFVLMNIMGFTINIMTLLALSLTVGLLIDDAIVVRENIFRKLENNFTPRQAAEKGTKEVMMAVIATTLTIVAVFFPIAFMEGVVGRFFKQFGLTVVFAMIISLFDALTMAPLLSAYFSGKPHKKMNIVVKTFERFQQFLDRLYEKTLRKVIRHPLQTVLIAILIFGTSLYSLRFVEKAFLPQIDDREFMLTLDLPSGTSLTGTHEATKKIETILQSYSEIDSYAISVGDGEGKANKATFYITLYPESKRKKSNAEVKVALRKDLTAMYNNYKPIIVEYSITGEPHPFAINLEGNNLEEMEKYSIQLINGLKKLPDLTDIGSNFEGGKPEYQVVLDQHKMSRLGTTPGIAGGELRNLIAGAVVGKLYEEGNEYNVRMRLKIDQRDMKTGYTQTKIPNINGMMIPLTEISTFAERTSPNQIVRENRKRIIQITGNVAPKGTLGTAVKQAENLFTTEMKPPAGIRANIVGEKENMEELSTNIAIALILSITIIFLVLSSLYGSFITPFTILVALPPAISGAFLALAVTHKTLDIFSEIGLVMLLGLVTKNSILLVDYAVKGVDQGMSRQEAIFHAGMTRLRPILMTTFAMLAGTIPIALGLGEAAKGRMSMGIAIIGGVLLSTILTLLVVPAIFSFIDRLRERIETPFTLDVIEKRLGFLMKTKKNKKK